MSFTQNRDEADTSVLGYTHQVYLKTQQLWCNSSRYQSNKSPGPTLGNLEESIQSRVETFSTKKHPKGKRFYSRSIRQLKGTQVVFFMSTGGAGPVTVTALWHFSFSACVSTSITSWNTQKHPVTSIHKKTCTANTREAQSISTNSMRI